MLATPARAVRRHPSLGALTYVAKVVLIAVTYWAAARISLDLALVRGQVTPVWPPTGIALVTFLMLGGRMWPAIALGAFAVNLPLGPTPVAAALIACGNTLAPLTATVLLRRAGFRPQLDRLRDAIALVLLGALIGMTISASVGTSVLTLSGAVPMSNFAATWAVWWAGDAMGVLLVAPTLLTFIPRPQVIRSGLRRSLAVVAVLCAVGVTTYLIFESSYRLEYLVLPLIAIVAWRFRLAVAAPAALIASVIAAWSAVHGHGSFASESLLEKMVTLQAFNVSLSLASFLLATYAEAHERSDEIARLYLSASLALTAKNDAIQVAVHELGPPIAVLTSYLAVLSDGKLGPAPRKWTAILNVMADKAWQIDRVIGEVAEAARIEARSGAAKPAILDLRETVRQAARRAAPRAEIVNAEIATNLGSELICVDADPRQIGRILDNLLHNSLTYSIRSPRIKLDTLVEGKRAIVRIIDNGVGLTEVERSRAFQPFQRTDDPAFHSVPGVGLGLYASQKLAEVNKGRLTLERSEPGVGSCFTLELPLAKAKATAKAS